MRVGPSRLQTVIRVKDIQVKGAQKELAQIKVKKDQEQVALDALQGQKTSAMSDAARTMKSRARDLQTSQAFLQSLSRQIKDQQSAVQAATEQEDSKRGELVEKTQSQQMISKIEEKRQAEQAKEDDRKAQRVIDVLAQRVKTGK